ncbi:MAG: hypothetical protein HYV97_01790 [Bdellovibrio sp.]|nr:hypothetical protein [Bdellovibrio sp.]
MRYLSIDLEATGLREQDSIIEFAMAPFCTVDKAIATTLCRSVYVKCEAFDTLKPTLDPWVIEHNEKLIRQAHSEGLTLIELQQYLTDYLASPEVINYFGTQNGQKIILFGKSMNALDLPFLNRDLGWEFMRKYFHHQVLDLSSVVRAFVDKRLLPPETVSGSALMKHLKMGDVAHTALEDAMNAAKIYLQLLS